MINLFHTINIPSVPNRKSYSFPTIPGEKIKVVKQSGDNFVIICDLKVLKTGGNSIIIASDKSSERYAEQIKLSVEDLLMKFTQDYIELKGALIEVSNGTVHPTDFNSQKVRTYFYNYFRKLLDA